MKTNFSKSDIMIVTKEEEGMQMNIDGCFLNSTEEWRLKFNIMTAELNVLRRIACASRLDSSKERKETT